MDYQLTIKDTILRIKDGAFIPKDSNNSDYQEYLKWLKKGNQPLPAPETPAPQELTPEEKLASAGLTVDDLKKLLGLL